MFKMHIPFKSFKFITPYSSVNMPYPYISHPLLDVGRSSSDLKHEVKVWLYENINNRYRFEFDSEANEYCIMFNSEQDMTWFKLRWS